MKAPEHTMGEVRAMGVRHLLSPATFTLMCIYAADADDDTRASPSWPLSGQHCV